MPIKETDSVKDLELQAKNTKAMMDRLNKAYLGMTTDELIMKALEGRKQDGKEAADE